MTLVTNLLAYNQRLSQPNGNRQPRMSNHGMSNHGMSNHGMSNHGMPTCVDLGKPNPNRDVFMALPDTDTGNWRSPIQRGTDLFSGSRSRGFVLDLNKNGRYDKGRDGVLVFDMNRDGRFNEKDVRSTNDMMKAAVSKFDFDGDGSTSSFEKSRGNFLKHKYNEMDRNNDGKLDRSEMGRRVVWFDKSGGGSIGNSNFQGLIGNRDQYRLPKRWHSDSSRVLESVRPNFVTTTSGHSLHRP